MGATEGVLSREDMWSHFHGYVQDISQKYKSGGIETLSEAFPVV